MSAWQVGVFISAGCLPGRKENIQMIFFVTLQAPAADTGSPDHRDTLTEFPVKMNLDGNMYTVSGEGLDELVSRVTAARHGSILFTWPCVLFVALVGLQA